jgi:hypothetical protein
MRVVIAGQGQPNANEPAIAQLGSRPLGFVVDRLGSRNSGGTLLVLCRGERNIARRYRSQENKPGN